MAKNAKNARIAKKARNGAPGSTARNATRAGFGPPVTAFLEALAILAFSALVTVTP
jgi:hypothetical protein